MEVNRFSNKPLYMQILDIIHERLGNDYYNIGEAALSDSSLMKEFDVSRITAKRVIDELAKIGLVTRERGKGTIINPMRKTVDFLMFEGMAEEAKKRNQKLSNKILTSETDTNIPEKVFDEVVNIGPSNNWFHLKRVRCIDDTPAMIDNIWLDMSVFPGISEYDFSNYSLKRTIEEKYHLTFTHVEQILELIRCEDDFSQLLAVPAGQQLLEANRAVYVESIEAPIMLALCYFRADLFRFHLSIDMSQ